MHTCSYRDIHKGFWNHYKLRQILYIDRNLSGSTGVSVKLIINKYSYWFYMCSAILSDASSIPASLTTADDERMDEKWVEENLPKSRQIVQGAALHAVMTKRQQRALFWAQGMC